MKPTKGIAICFLALLLLQCNGKQKPTIIDITAPTGVQIFRQPRAGLKPPFLFSADIFETKYAYTKSDIKPAQAGTQFTGQVMEAMSRQYKGDLEAAVKDAALSVNIAEELAKQVNFTIDARGLKVYMVSPSDVEFKGGTDCVSYMTSFKDNNSKLVLETFSADSLIITASNTHSEEFKAALKAKLGEQFKANFEMVEKGEGKTAYTITGQNLVYGYTAASLLIELYSADKPLSLDAPIDKEVDIASTFGVEWIRAIRVEQTGDGQSYLIRIYPKFGESAFLRLSRGEQKDLAVGKRLVLTIALKDTAGSKVKLSLTGFNLTFKGAS